MLDHADDFNFNRRVFPMMTRQPLFQAREGGYFNYRIPGLAVTPGGAVLAYCEARRNDGGDHDVIDILMRRSTDGGVTWSTPQIVADHCEFPETTMNNFVCIGDTKARRTHALFCNRYHRVYHMFSEDDGQNWSKPREITDVFEGFQNTYPWTIVAVGPGHGLQHSSGRLIAPCWLSPGTNFHLPNRVGCIYSDDHGQTWQSAGMLPDNYPNTNEPVAVELSDGRVMINTRCAHEIHRRLISISPDGRGNWSDWQPVEDLVDPICFGSIHRYDAKTILFSNPDSTTTELTGNWNLTYDRRNLTVRASYDDGFTWPIKRPLESGPSGYSDLAVLSDGTILCLFEHGMIKAMSDPARLTLARFDMAWLSGAAEE